jgi:UDP-4-amino-4,6-dideoxy-N-acetyl-beta-L-altrosamine transaminase
VSEPTLPYGRQLIEDDDVAEVVRVLRSDFLTTGPEVEAFEGELAAACGARHAVAVANGTAALHCAYAALGIGPGDEVVTSPLTFSATANMVLALGAKPVFADVSPETLCLDPEKAEAAIGPRTKAIAAVDFAGHPAALDRLMEIARRRGLWVVEDAAHSIGGKLRGRPVGSLAHATTFSFHPVKTVTTGEGGAVLTDDAEVARRARDFRNHGMVREPERLSRNDGPWYYEVQSLGFNYRLTAIQCALGRSQLRKLSRFVARRRAIVARYREGLAGTAGLRWVNEAEGVEAAWHLFAVEVTAGAAARAALFQALRERAIAPQVHYVAVNDLPLYRALGHDPRATPIAQRASQSLISLPLYPALTDGEVDRVIRAVREAVR